MDEFNNAPNPFNEDNNGGKSNSENQYNMPGVDPLGSQPQQNAGQYNDPYNQQPQQNAGQYNDPYNQQPQQSAGQYNDPYNQQPQQSAGQYNNPYNQQPQQNAGQYNPYSQSNQQQYNMPNNPYQQNYTYPQQGYAQQQSYGMPYQRPQSTGMAVASLVLGIISIVMGLFMFAAPVLFLVPIIGIILGIVFKCKRFSVGKGLSTAGIITSSIGLAIPVILLIFVMVMLVTHGAELMEYIKQISPDQYEELYELYGDQFPEWFDGIMSFIIK